MPVAGQPRAARARTRTRLAFALGVGVLACAIAPARSSAASLATDVPYGFAKGGALMPGATSLTLDRTDPAPWLAAKRSASSMEGQPALSPERAQVLLRSLTIPGWGQAQRGHYTAAGIFAFAELSVWTAFTAYSIQGNMRSAAYKKSALHLAGIDLNGRDEEFRRIVGAFISSDEYNQLVVYRDAANLFYDDPLLYRQYIEEHSLRGGDTWSWQSEESLLRYQGQRKNAQRAERRANTTLALAVLNRLVSALHAARLSGSAGHEEARSWRIEVAPAPGEDPTALRLGVHASF